MPSVSQVSKSPVTKYLQANKYRIEKNNNYVHWCSWYVFLWRK